MCYFLYGAVNSGIRMDDAQSVSAGSLFHFTAGDRESVNACVERCGSDYRLTNRHCDCETAVGAHDPDRPELAELCDLLYALRTVRGVKHVYLSKNWAYETNQSQIVRHIDDLDLKPFLADLEENCLYKIQLFKRY